MDKDSLVILPEGKEPEEYALVVDSTKYVFKTFNSALEFITKNNIVSFTVRNNFGGDLTYLAYSILNWRHK